MKNIIIFGYGIAGLQAHEWLREREEYKFCGFADNSPYKQGHYVCGKKIINMDELIKLNKELDFYVIIGVRRWWELADQCKEEGIRVEGIFSNGGLHSDEHMEFTRLDLSKEIKLYAGDIMDEFHRNEENLYGLSITKSDKKHIFHNIMNAYPLPDECIAGYEAEEVLEYIPRECQKFVLDEIYRILKTGGRCRITLPDFNSPCIKRRIMTDEEGNPIFDPGGGGNYGKDGIENGEVYFPTYEDFSKILAQTKFTTVDWLCYHTKDGQLHKRYIDTDNAYNRRVTNDTNEDVFCIVVDCYK